MMLKISNLCCDSSTAVVVAVGGVVVEEDCCWGALVGAAVAGVAYKIFSHAHYTLQVFICLCVCFCI